MDPERGVAVREIDRLSCISVVDVDVRFPALVARAHAGRKSVEQRPQDAVADPSVERLQERRREVETRACRDDGVIDADVGSMIAIVPAPTEPDTALVTKGRLHCRDQSANLARATSARRGPRGLRESPRFEAETRAPSSPLEV